MKKNELLIRLNAMVALEDNSVDILTALQELIDDIGTTEVEDKGKLTYFVKVNERKLDPAMKYPKQMLLCYDIIAELEKPELTLAEIKEAIGVSAERLGTRQDPYRIYAFYQKRMSDEGWIGREKSRI